MQNSCNCCYPHCLSQLGITLKVCQLFCMIKPRHVCCVTCALLLASSNICIIRTSNFEYKWASKDNVVSLKHVSDP